MVRRCCSNKIRLLNKKSQSGKRAGYIIFAIQRSRFRILSNSLCRNNL
nr:MAG TPA: hypothetical protein [Bacteriophage sp.]